jgi:protein-S-isoprenylcysteine O-methyltransferase
MLMVVIWVLVVLSPVSEIVLSIVKRSKSKPAGNQDQGTLWQVWFAVAGGVVAALIGQRVRATHLNVRYPLLELIALVLMVVGLSVRWWSVVVLGRYFTTDVSVQAQQPVIRTGPYRLVRHPAYAGALLAFTGLGVLMHNWFSLAVLLIPVTAAMVSRILVEERALLATIGKPYAEYCRQTKRLIPGLF